MKNECVGSQPSRFRVSPHRVCSNSSLPGQLAKVADLAKQVPQVAECHRITGRNCFILKINLTDVFLVRSDSRSLSRPRSNDDIHCPIITCATALSSAPEEGRLNRQFVLNPVHPFSLVPSSAPLRSSQLMKIRQPATWHLSTIRLVCCFQNYLA